MIALSFPNEELLGDGLTHTLALASRLNGTIIVVG